jgi:hypothetical protein
MLITGYCEHLYQFVLISTLGSKAVEYNMTLYLIRLSVRRNESRDVGSMGFNVKCHSTKTCASVEYPYLRPR